MIYSPKIEKAIGFAIRIHQSDQDQRRKISKAPYIIHPLSVGIILARVGADEDTIITGILHDTVEDTNQDRALVRKEILDTFGSNVALMVEDLTEPSEEEDWVVQKRTATEQVARSSHNTQLVKAADMLHNITDYIEDYKKIGETMFTEYFIQATKKSQLEMYQNRLSALKGSWPSNPLLPELKEKIDALSDLWK